MKLIDGLTAGRKDLAHPESGFAGSFALLAVLGFVAMWSASSGYGIRLVKCLHNNVFKSINSSNDGNWINAAVHPNKPFLVRISLFVTDSPAPNYWRIAACFGCLYQFRRVFSLQNNLVND